MTTNAAAETICLPPDGPRYLIPIKGYFALMYIVVLCLLFPSISYFFYNQTTSFRDSQLERTVKDQTRALEQRAALLLNSLSRSGSQAISGYNYSFLSILIRRAVDNDQELLACEFFSAEENQVAAAINLPGMTPEEAFNSTGIHHKAESHGNLDTDRALSPVVFTEYQPEGADIPHLLLARVPVNMGGKVWGFVYAAFSLERRNQLIEKYKQEWDEQMQQYRFFLVGVTAIFFVLGVFSAVLFTRPLVRSLKGLQDGVDRVAGGDLSHTLGFGRIVCKEFVSLGQSFNSMTDNLRLSRKQLDEYAHTLEEKVEERTRDLQEAQTELLNQAHEAGMAEMAVGVLHNIGNAITPAKVGAQLLARQLEKSPLRTELAKVLQQLPDVIAEGELPAEDKERLQKIISLLPASITQEFDQAIEGLHSISDKHHYIENIISLQMHYARLHTTPDLINCNRIVDDSLKILDKELHRVQVTTDLQSTSEVCVEESKLLQILVNLIKNSVEAMADNENQRTLTISSADLDDEVLITVADNGCGFDDDVRKKMFRFGYSSKARGSGFGLHSCANYLIANNGSLNGVSDGAGKGAVFTVHLPVAQSKERAQHS